MGRYTPPAPETANIDVRLSTLAAVLRDVAAVDPVTYAACALSNIDAVVVVVTAAEHKLL